jgi:lysophospholipase L1-like esterase
MHCYSSLKKDIAESTHQLSPSYRFRPSTHGFLMDSPVFINSNGFRGKEIPAEKGNAYRIVVIGESTTFGMTFKKTDKPWPDLLEQMIHDRLKTRRPVQVINAGVPAYTILDNLARLPWQVLPVKPDMIISYHGANGFYFIDPNLVRPMARVPVTYQDRPLMLAGDFEYKFKLFLVRKKQRPNVVFNARSLANPMESEYADAYRRLIRFAATNGIRLMLANYSMSVNESSPPAVLDFYQGAELDSIRGHIKANKLHSQIVEQLAAENPGVGFIDTHPHLDGEYKKFIDALHFTQEGREQMAENMFAGIRKTLEHDIGTTDSR